MTNPDTRAHVFNLVAQIPRGKVTTYGQLAKLAGIANPRQVGRILHTNTTPELYPCHRVVRADGSLADGYAFGQRNAQRQILESEGIVFIKDKIVLATQLWQPTVTSKLNK